jgi:hypothetical protein
MIRAKCRCCDDVVFVQRVTIVGADEQQVLDAVNALPCSPSLYVYYDEPDLTNEGMSDDGNADSTLN